MLIGKLFSTLILFSLTMVAKQSFQDVEVIYLPTMSTEELQWKDEIPLVFTAFGRHIELRLEKNRKLVAESFKVWRYEERIGMTRLSELGKAPSCHYIHRGEGTTAAASLCEKDSMNALVLLDDVILEITPLEDRRIEGDEFSGSSFGRINTRLAMVDDYAGEVGGRINNEQGQGRAHLVKRSLLTRITRAEDEHLMKKKQNIMLDAETMVNSRRDDQDDPRRMRNISIELSLFFDSAGYNLFGDYLDKNEVRMRDMLLAYVNGVQAIFHHPSLGRRVDLVLVRLEIMKNQPVDLPHFGGERERLLDSFCQYSSVRNPQGDDDPDHWDMGLYVSGLDFYALEADGRKNGLTMGLAPVDGACHQLYSCVIAELGATNRFGNPYPSAGFTSIYIAAHEIGHNLGMRHDSSGNSCSKDGYVMSPSRGIFGETTWSGCSRIVALGLEENKPCLLDEPGENWQIDHASRYRDMPGQQWTSKRQCELLLRDKEASVVEPLNSLMNVCQGLRCKTPRRGGYYYAGPALDGTTCARARQCRGGECLPIPQHRATNPWCNDCSHSATPMRSTFLPSRILSQ